MKKVCVQKGSVYGKLTFTGDEISKRNKRFLNCICFCGKIGYYELYKLRTGHTKTCGNHLREMSRERNITHNFSKTRTYKSWCEMKARIKNTRNHKYPAYGGRGITFDQRWDDFENFLEDMGERPKGTTLDRIDNNGNYCKNNCRWATAKTQAQNKRNNVVIIFRNEKHCISEWARILGINEGTLRSRLSSGKMTTEDALKNPVCAEKRNSRALCLSSS